MKAQGQALRILSFKVKEGLFVGSKLKVGIIGCGGIANGAHLPGYAALTDKVELYAACDIIPERAEKAKEQYDMKYAFEDFNKVLELDELDVISVCTPNNVHNAASIASLNAGKHVLCEKPLARTPGEAREIIVAADAAEKNNQKFSVGYMTRFGADTMLLRQMIANGELGDIYWARASYLRRRGVPTWGVFMDKEKQGGGPLIDIGTHILDLTLWLMDNYEPETVLGSSYNHLGLQGGIGMGDRPWKGEEYEVEDLATGFIKFKNGATVTLEASWALNIEEEVHNVVLSGTKAGAETHPMRVNGVKYDRMYTWKPREKRQQPKLHSLEIEHFVDCVLKDEKPMVTGRQALVVTEILDAIYRSAASGEAVKF